MSNEAPKCLTGNKTAIEEFLSKFDVFLFDCDGVLWSGDHVFPGVGDTIRMLRDMGKRTVFVSNNSTKTRETSLSKLAKASIPATAEDVFSSAYSSAVYLARVLRIGSTERPKVFVIGEEGIESELRREGLEVVGGTDARFRRDMEPADFSTLADGSALDPAVGVVLCGLDFHINYLKMSTALAYLRKGARFVATNTDATLPMQGAFFPGAGSTSVVPIANMLEARGGNSTPLECGKPSQAMMDAIEGKFKLDRARTCMVGDRLETDIKFGIDGKLGGTLAVLSGVMKKEDWESEGAVARPQWYVNGISDLTIVAKGT